MADENELINQDEIERLLRNSMGGEADGHAPQTSQPPVQPTVAPPQVSHRPGPTPQESKGIGVDRPTSSAASGQFSDQLTEADRLLGQAEIDRLTGQAGVSGVSAPKAPAARSEAASAASVSDFGIAQADMETLLHQAERALASIEEGPAEAVPPGTAPFRWEELSAVAANTESANLDLIRDVELDLRIELGRTQMYLEDVLKLRRGSVVTLDKMAGDPVDIFVNGRLVAKGEVLVLNDNFCVRVAELVAGVSSGQVALKQ
jgi:flagellar motor switch protein FliN/FliY